VTREWGVFNDEGCIEAQFYDALAADEAAQQERELGDPHARAAEICPDHEQQPKDGCEVCWAEDDED
jgi:hypothetical protein